MSGSACASVPGGSVPSGGGVTVGVPHDGGILRPYGFLGFDLDHTLARYKLDAFAPFLFGLLRDYLVQQRGYPARLQQWQYDATATHKALLWDGALGNCVKLGADRSVLAASHGCVWGDEGDDQTAAAARTIVPRMLTSEEIRAAYPRPLEEFDGSRHPRFHPLYTFFEMPCAPLLQLIVEYTDRALLPADALRGSTGSNPYGHIFPAIGGAYEFHLSSPTRGDYFPAFRVDPGRFLHRRAEVAAWLQQLRAAGHFVFLATNSKLDYTELLCAYSFGDDWRKLFDLVIVDAKKPSWFMSGPEHLPRALTTAQPDRSASNGMSAPAHPESLSPSSLAACIDQTLLSASASRDQITALCAEALSFGFASVCVNALWAPLVSSLLRGSGVRTCVVVGFPLGASTPAAKAFEAAEAVRAGAQEVDMVIDVAAARAMDRATVEADVRAVADAVHAGGAKLKVIIEACLLSDAQKVLACEAAVAAGADFVKTSTGFSSGGATEADVALMRRTVGGAVGVKASGGVRTKDDAVRMLRAGASRIGASSGPQIVKGTVTAAAQATATAATAAPATGGGYDAPAPAPSSVPVVAPTAAPTATPAAPEASVVVTTANSSVVVPASQLPRPFYFHDPVTLAADTTRPPASLDDLRVPHSLYVHGNATMLTELFRQIQAEKVHQAKQGQATVGTSSASSSTEPRVIYFGDHLHTDCMATRQYTTWAAGAVVEEIEEWHAQSATVDPDAAAAVACAALQCRHETFGSLHRLIGTEASQAKCNGSSAFGGFFHHHRAAAPCPTHSTDGAASVAVPTSAPVPEWTYWHHVLQQHCDVVVGCLTDCIPLSAGANVSLSAPTAGVAKAAAPTVPAAGGASSPSAALSTSFPGYVGPRLNSSCIHPPTLVRFQPPPFGSAYGGVNTPAKRDADAAAATAANTGAGSAAAAPTPRPAVTSLQYSIHRVPLSMKQELRPIFPELSSTSDSAGSPLSLTAFKSLPILAIPTFQPAARPMVSFSADVELEKNRLLECFDAWARRVCLRLRAGEQGDAAAAPAWADLVDPCSGYPTLGPHGSSVYSEVDGAQILLAYRMEQVGNCSVIDHPQWHLAHFPATLLTTAPIERVQQVIQQVQEELRAEEEA